MQQMQKISLNIPKSTENFLKDVKNRTNYFEIWLFSQSGRKFVDRIKNSAFTYLRKINDYRRWKEKGKAKKEIKL